VLAHEKVTIGARNLPSDKRVEAGNEADYGAKKGINRCNRSAASEGGEAHLNISSCDLLKKNGLVQ
jgi:hypothetical protein